jgi:putative transposase
LLQATKGKSQSGVAGQQVGVRQVDEHIWLVTIMHYVLEYFDDETCRLELIDNPFGPTVLPMSPE